MKGLLGSRKGVSPILATLLLIIIVVAIGLTLYAWVTGYTGTQTAKAREELVIEAVNVIDKSKVTIYVRNTGTVRLKLGAAYIIDPASGKVLISGTGWDKSELDPGKGTYINLWDGFALTSGNVYKARVTTKGGLVVETEFRYG